MNNFKKIGKFIQHKREQVGLTQDELAAKLGVSKATISLYESGARKPSLSRLSEIATITRTPLNKFLSLDNPKVDLDFALRSEGITNDDIERIKTYIQIVKDADKAREKQSA